MLLILGIWGIVVAAAALGAAIGAGIAEAIDYFQEDDDEKAKKMIAELRTLEEQRRTADNERMTAMTNEAQRMAQQLATMRTEFENRRKERGEPQTQINTFTNYNFWKEHGYSEAIPAHRNFSEEAWQTVCNLFLGGSPYGDDTTTCGQVHVYDVGAGDWVGVNRILPETECRTSFGEWRNAADITWGPMCLDDDDPRVPKIADALQLKRDFLSGELNTAYSYFSDTSRLMRQHAPGLIAAFDAGATALMRCFIDEQAAFRALFDYLVQIGDVEDSFETPYQRLYETSKTEEPQDCMTPLVYAAVLIKEVEQQIAAITQDITNKGYQTQTIGGAVQLKIDGEWVDAKAYYNRRIQEKLADLFAYIGNPQGMTAEARQGIIEQAIALSEARCRSRGACCDQATDLLIKLRCDLRGDLAGIRNIDLTDLLGTTPPRPVPTCDCKASTAALPECRPECDTRPPVGHCGDGIVQRARGEECDGDPNCGPDCKIPPPPPQQGGFNWNVNSFRDRVQGQ